MRKTVTLSLPKDLKDDLDRLVKQEGVSRSDVLRESLRDYLWVRKFRRLRRMGIKRAQAKGIFTDQDVFDRIS